MTDTVRLLSRDRAELIAGLAAAELESPYAFIRVLDAAYDRRIHVEQLLRELPEEDDLRFAHGTRNNERWVLAERLPWDSTFFGYGVARLRAVLAPSGPIDLRADVAPAVRAIDAALARARAAGVAYVFATVAARDLPTLRALHGSGFELIESRITHHRRLAPAAERYDVRLATPEDIPSLARAARGTVNAYDRFHADPAVSTEDAARLMERWVRASITEGYADATIVPNVEEPEAFVTARLYREHWDGWGLKLGQPVVSAVAPRHRGWYVQLISEFGELLLAEGAEHALLTTQVTNNAVVHSWEKLGYKYGKAEHVFRRLV